MSMSSTHTLAYVFVFGALLSIGLLAAIMKIRAMIQQAGFELCCIFS